MPDFQANRTEHITATSQLTPSICRVNTLLRRETLCIYAAHANFIISMDEGASFWPNRVASWLNALGPELLTRIRSIQLSRHWAIPSPLRYQGHVGFYIKVDLTKTRPPFSGLAWQYPPNQQPTSGDFADHFPNRQEAELNERVTGGTYPIARDSRNFRYHCLVRLKRIIGNHFARKTPPEGVAAAADEGEVTRLQCSDVEFMIRTMDIVATHPLVPGKPYSSDACERALDLCHQSLKQASLLLPANNAELPGFGDQTIDIKSSHD